MILINKTLDLYNLIWPLKRKTKKKLNPERFKEEKINLTKTDFIGPYMRVSN